MTKVNCPYTLCEYNSGCCQISHNKETYCTKSEITLDEKERMADFGELECTDFLESDKKYICSKCQIKKNGYVVLDVENESMKIKNTTTLEKITFEPDSNIDK